MKIPAFVLPLLWRLPLVLKGLLILCVLWQAAGLLWLVFAPWPQHGALLMPAPLPAAQALSSQRLRQWFAAAGTDVPANASANATNLQLLAVISGQSGLAVFTQGPAQGSGETLVVAVGEEIYPGTRLLGVQADAVDIESGGQRQRLALPAYLGEAGNVAAIQISPAANTAQRGMSALGSSSSVGAEKTLTLKRGALSDILRQKNLATWGDGLSSYRDGGILIENVARQPLAQALQLENGDILQKVNDQAIRQLGDISRVYSAFGQAPSARLSLLRNGAPFVLNYRIKP